MVKRGINKVILIGNLGQNPELRYMPNGNAVTNINLATSESWRDKSTSEIKEHTEWHRVVIFGKLAEVASEYLRKGSQVYIEGQLRTRKWTDQSGQEKYITEVVVNIGGTMQMLGTRQISNQISSQQQQQQQQIEDQLNNNTQSSPTHNQTISSTSNETTMEFDDDIPF